MLLSHAELKLERHESHSRASDIPELMSPAGNPGRLATLQPQDGSFYAVTSDSSRLILQLQIGNGDQQHVIARSRRAKAFPRRKRGSSERYIPETERPQGFKMASSSAPTQRLSGVPSAFASVRGKRPRFQRDQHAAKLGGSRVGDQFGFKTGKEANIPRRKLGHVLVLLSGEGNGSRSE